MSNTYNPCITIGKNGVIAYDENNDEIITPKINASALGNDLKATILDLIYPIGSIYTTTDETKNPATLFGGTWTNIKDVFLYASDPSNPPQSLTGGSKTITIDNLPSHGHTVNINTNETGNHSHTQQTLLYESGRSDGINGRYDQNGESWSGNHLIPLYQMINTVDAGNHTHNVNGSTGNTGNGSDYMPPYRVVYVYERTA